MFALNEHSRRTGKKKREGEEDQKKRTFGALNRENPEYNEICRNFEYLATIDIKKNCTKKTLMTRITMMGWSLTPSQTFWSVKSSGP